MGEEDDVEPGAPHHRLDVRERVDADRLAVMGYSMGGGGASRLDPVEREAKTLAESYVREDLRKKGRKWNQVPDGMTEEQWIEKRSSVVEQLMTSEGILKLAKQRVQQKTKVADAIKEQRAKEQLEQKAKDLAARISGPDGIKAAGEREGFEAGLEESFKLGGSLGKAGSSTALDDLIYSLKPGEFSKTPIKVDDKWVIVGVTKKYDADMGVFAGQRDTLKQSMMSELQEQVFEDYIAGVQQQMKKDGKIKIYEDVLSQLDESEPAAEPALPGGLNFPPG